MTPTHRPHHAPRPQHASRVRPLAARCALVAFALVAGACSLNDADTDVAAIDLEPTTTVAPDTTPDTTVVQIDDGAQMMGMTPQTIGSASGDAPATTVAPAPSTSQSTTVPPVNVAGEPLDFAPAAGTPLMVVGVAHDDVLNFRVDPDPQATILTAAAPLVEADIVSAGAAWSHPTGVWWMVTVDGQTAWANQRYLAAAGGTFDVSAEVLADLDGAEYEVLLDAGMAAAGTRVNGGGPEPRFVQANEALLFDDRGWITIDVLDLGDDSVKGERLLVTVETIFDEDSGEPGAQDVLGVRVVSVEVTPLCGRGESDGFCL